MSRAHFTRFKSRQISKRAISQKLTNYLFQYLLNYVTAILDY